MYHNQQPGSSYDYPSYPNTQFESTAPTAQQSARPVRSNTSQTQSPQQQSDFHPSPPYASSTPYPSASYGIPPGHAQQWQHESWASHQYAQPFTSQSMQAEMTYASAAPRPDAPPPASTPDARVFPPSSLSQPHEPRRQDGTYSQPLPAASSHNSSPPRTRRREKDPSAVPPPAAPAPGPDFAKIQGSYRLIMDNANSMMTSGTSTAPSPPQAESFELMLHSANLGMQILESAVVQSNPDVRPTANMGTKDAPAPKRQKGDDQQDTQTCLGCNATSTPEWRRGPLGPRTLCNACGLVYAKLLKKRARGEARSRASDNGGQSSHHPVDESNAPSSGGSEDEDSYGSQDRKSDFGDHGRRG